MSETAETHRAYIRWLMRRTHKDITPLGADAGLSPSTLGRMKDDDFLGFGPSTIRKLTAHYNVPGPEAWAMGIAEEDVAPLEGDAPSIDLKKLAKASDQEILWRVDTNDLAGAGVCRGDIIVIDPSAKPETGDIVVAQHYDMTRGAAKTILRLYNSGRITRANMTGEPDDILTVDPTTNVGIFGVMTTLIRTRKKS